MAKLVMEYDYDAGGDSSITIRVPLLYESKEKCIQDFNKIINKFLETPDKKEQESIFDFAGYEGFDVYDFIQPEVYGKGWSGRYVYTQPKIYELEEWFNKTVIGNAISVITPSDVAYDDE